MIIGDTSTFAIESGIARAYERSSYIALGYFCMHIGGLRYGLYEPEATFMALPLKDAGERVNDRGKHVVSFSSEPSAEHILDEVLSASYGPEPGDRLFFGMTEKQHSKVMISSQCEMINDFGDAFDDNSYILQFDVGDKVRLIACTGPRDAPGDSYDRDTVRDVWIDADKFYGILSEWAEAFEAEWRGMKKIPEAEDRADLRKAKNSHDNSVA